MDEELQKKDENIELAPIKNESLDLVDRILTANRTSESLAEFREKATEEQTD
jgi:hypothetical protein